jgi:phage gp36-like protein
MRVSCHGVVWDNDPSSGNNDLCILFHAKRLTGSTFALHARHWHMAHAKQELLVAHCCRGARQWLAARRLISDRTSWRACNNVIAHVHLAQGRLGCCLAAARAAVSAAINESAQKV